MPSQQNIQTVKELADKLSRSKAVALADYRGLSMLQMKEIRGQIAALNADLTVAKNRLLKIALRQSNLSGGAALTDSLAGPSAILICYEDEVGPIKALYEYSLKNQLPQLKVGFLGRDFLSADRLVNLAKLPGKPELQARLVGTLNGPIYGLVTVLQGNLRKLVCVLQAIKDKNIN